MAFYLSQVAFTPAPVDIPVPPWVPSTFDWTEPSQAWVRRPGDLAAALDLGGYGHGTFAQSPLVILTLPAGTSKATFEAATQNMTIDVIQLAADNNNTWDAVHVDVDRTARPLLICPAAGATIRFVGPGVTSAGTIFMGLNSLTKWITWDGLKPDGFLFDGITTAAAGIWENRSGIHNTFRNMTYRNLVRDHFIGDTPAPWKTWCFYNSMGSGVRNHDFLLIEDQWLEAPAVRRDRSAFVFGSSTLTNGTITIRNIHQMDQYKYGIYIDVPGNYTLDTWAMNDVGYEPGPASIRTTAKSIQGVYKNITATACDPLLNQSTGVFANGGGNSGI